MSRKFKTRIEITSPAENKDEAMEIVGDYLSGNIMSGIDMKYATRQIRFYDHSAAKAVAIVLLVAIGFLFSVKTPGQANLNMGTCQMAAVQPPLKTSKVSIGEANFKKAWEDKQIHEAIGFIKK
ncbi:MAG: hypothetical protein Q8R38_02975 [Candidatus Omnitrophota bacterium]|nr:hypothetical protein [Candidatus Omnitrophota bacterium]